MSNKVSYLKRDGAWIKHTTTEDEEIFEQITSPETIGILENVTAVPKEGEILTRTPITTPANPPNSVVTLPDKGGVKKDFEWETTSEAVDELYKMSERVKRAKADPRYSASEKDYQGKMKLDELWAKAEKQLMRDFRRGKSLEAFSMIVCPKCNRGINQYADNFNPKNPVCPYCSFDLTTIKPLGEF